MTLEDAIDLILGRAGLKITIPDITAAYAYCKITIVDEMKQKEKYERLVFVEFLEFIGRVAEFVHKENTGPLIGKMEKVLDQLYKVVGWKRQFLHIAEEGESESDYSDSGET